MESVSPTSAWWFPNCSLLWYGKILHFKISKGWMWFAKVLIHPQFSINFFFFNLFLFYFIYIIESPTTNFCQWMAKMAKYHFLKKYYVIYHCLVNISNVSLFWNSILWTRVTSKNFKIFSWYSNTMENSIFTNSSFKKSNRLLNILQTVVNSYMFSQIVVYGHFGPTQRMVMTQYTCWSYNTISLQKCTH